MYGPPTRSVVSWPTWGLLICMNLFKQAVRMAYTRTQTKDPRSEVFIMDVMLPATRGNDIGASWLFWLLRLINTLTYLLISI